MKKNKADVDSKNFSRGWMLRMQRLNSLELIAGGIGHDFNNVLTSIMNNISLAKMYSSPGDRVYDKLKAAEENFWVAKHLTQQLLTLSKSDGQSKKNIHVEKLITETISFALSGSNIKLNVQPSIGISRVSADPGQIAQVFSNITINARQAMPNGGEITVSFENLKNHKCTCVSSDIGQCVRIKVKDTGHGIQASDLERIFDPYFTTKHHGIGLGLSVSRSIIQKHNGLISATSIAGEGALFQICLPAAEGSSNEAEESKQLMLSGCGKILIMDDDEGIRETLTEMLRYLGYDAKAATDGKEAVRFYKEAYISGKPYNAVIADLTVPGGEGAEYVLRTLLEVNPKVKVIVTSGYANDSIMTGYKAKGFCGVVAKPYEIEELSNVLYESVCRK